ncbi:MAG: ABC transporter permease, partial [Coriobacteriia bacterium]
PAALGYALAARRDVGAGLMAPRAGKARAAGWLGTPFGLAWRLERRAIMWWAIGLGLLGMSMGAFAERAVPGEMPEALLVVLGGAENITAGYLAYMGVFMATIVAVYAVLALQGLRAEETGGRGEPILATAVSRWSWLGANLLVGAIGVVVIMAVAGAMTGLGAASALGNNSLIWDVTAAHLNHVPPVLVVLGVAALLFGLLPRATGAAWVVVAYGFMMGTFGALMDLPEVAFTLSPFEHPARMPLEEFEVVPVVVLVAIAAALVAAGLVAFRRRDLDVT